MRRSVLITLVAVIIAALLLLAWIRFVVFHKEEWAQAKFGHFYDGEEMERMRSWGIPAG